MARTRVREPEPLPPFEYLLESSRSSLHDFWLAKLYKTGNLEKEMREIFREWIEAQALVLLSEWFIKHGEELIALAVARPEKLPEVKLENPIPVAKPKRYEFWRDNDKRRFSSRRRAG